MEITDLRQRHLAAFTAALREMKPEGVDSVLVLPPAERYGIGVLAAFKAGWFSGPDLPENPAEWVGDLTYQEADSWSKKVWEAWSKATVLDPNS